VRRRSLVVKLLLLSAAGVIIPALILTVIIGSVSRHYVGKTIQSHQTEVARRVAEKINGQIEHVQSVVHYVANLPSMAGVDAAEQRRVLYNLLNSLPSVQEAMLIVNSRESLKVSRTGARPVLLSRRGDLTQSYVGKPFFSGNRLPTILLSEPVNPPVRPARAVMVKVSFDALGELLAQTRIGESGIAYIVNPRGSVLAHPNQELAQAHADFSGLPVVAAWRQEPDRPTKLMEFESDGKAHVLAIAHPIPLLQSAVVVQQSRDEVYGALERMQNRMVLWTLVTLLVLLGLTLTVAWRILKPLRKMQAAAEKISHGDLDVHLEIRTRDELEDLGEAFERMADSLRRLDALRKDLINMIIHDLKTPLSNIMASVDYLLSGEIGVLSDVQRKLVATSRRAGQDMLVMIQNLLDVARLEEGKLTLKRDSFAPTPWAEKVVSAFQPVARAAQKTLRLQSTAELPDVVGDIALLNRVLANLISNAVSHTLPTVGEVTVALFPSTDYLVIEVRDNGEGIPIEDQKRIFEKFVQGQRKMGRHGSGLGLTFCKMVVEAHGGRIYVVSAPQQGSCFTFHLPYAHSLTTEPPPVSQPDAAIR
jgi:signal transduction histidine kinase